MGNCALEKIYIIIIIIIVIIFIIIIFIYYIYYYYYYNLRRPALLRYHLRLQGGGINLGYGLVYGKNGATDSP